MQTAAEAGLIGRTYGVKPGITTSAVAGPINSR